MRRYGKSRRELFEAIERVALRPLPTTRFEYTEWQKARVNIDYHVQVEGHFYSVPYKLVHEEVEARLCGDASRSCTVAHASRRIVGRR